MRGARVWHGLLGVQHTVIEGVEFVDRGGVDGAGEVVVHVRPAVSASGRCGRCGLRCPRYDNGQGRRRWRALDLGLLRLTLEADAPRVCCPEHGMVVASVPWARHDARHTRAFDQTVAWLATRMSKSAVTCLMLIAWRTVGSIVARVWKDSEELEDRFEGLRRLGIDEVSYRRGHRYLMVVVDQDSGRLVWAAPGRTTATLQQFFDLLGPERCALITHVAADGAPFISTVVAKNCANAVRCADPFHVIAWATEALDELRRRVIRDARKQARRTGLTALKGGTRPDATRPADDPVRRMRGARGALLNNQENLKADQRVVLDWIATTDPVLHTAYLLKEGLRAVFKMPPDAVEAGLDGWLSWAQRCRIPRFVTLARRIKAHRASIIAAITEGMSNGRTESVNGKIRLITRTAYGFHSPQALIALAMLQLGGHRPDLPVRR